MHVRAKDADALRFGAPPDANAHLELLNAAGAVLLRIAFRRTNAAKSDKFDAARLRAVKDRFGHLAPYRQRRHRCRQRCQ